MTMRTTPFFLACEKVKTCCIFIKIQSLLLRKLSIGDEIHRPEWT